MPQSNPAGSRVERSRFRVRRVEGAPLVAVRVVLGGGARRESTPGESLITGRALAEGTRRQSYRALAAAAEARGMNLAGFGSYEATGVAVDGLAADWEAAVDLAAEMVFESTFPAERISWLIRQAAAELEAQADEADLATGLAFADLLYAPHPRGRPLQGDPKSLERLDSGACSRSHSAALGLGGVVIVAGAIDEEAVLRRVEGSFAGLAPLAPDPYAPTGPPPPSARRREIRTRARDQAHLFVGQLTVGRRHPDCAALELASVVLGAGSGLSGRIPNRIRDREGLAYHASANAVAGAGLDPGHLVAYVGTSPANLAAAERSIVEELVRLREEGPADREIDEARSFLAGREPFRRETARQWAELAALGAIEGLPLEDPGWSVARIEGPSRNEVAAALAAHLDPVRLGVAVGRPGRSPSTGSNPRSGLLEPGTNGHSPGPGGTFEPV